MKIIACKSDKCQAPIVKAVFETTGNVGVFNADPVRGHELRDRPNLRGLYELLEREGTLPIARGATSIVHELYEAHFATCPDAERFRGKGRRS